jgi:hypothetical protein
MIPQVQYMQSRVAVQPQQPQEAVRYVSVPAQGSAPPVQQAPVQRVMYVQSQAPLQQPQQAVRYVSVPAQGSAPPMQQAPVQYVASQPVVTIAQQPLVYSQQPQVRAVTPPPQVQPQVTYPGQDHGAA